MGLPQIPGVRHRSSPNSEDPESLRAAEHAEEVIKEEVPRKWRSYVWDTLDKPKEERWFMFKLDAAILTFASLG
jgi:hypothetical protein